MACAPPKDVIVVAVVPSGLGMGRTSPDVDHGTRCLALAQAANDWALAGTIVVGSGPMGSCTGTAAHWCGLLVSSLI